MCNIPLVNRKKLGCLKDELNSQIILEFVGLRAKLYAYKTENNKAETKKAKGITKSTLKTIVFEDYVNCLLTQNNLYRNQILIQTKDFLVYTVKQKKLVLNAQDEKRKIDKNNISTYAWGHCRIP